jgi:hypothetical protein
MSECLVDLGDPPMSEWEPLGWANDGDARRVRPIVWTTPQCVGVIERGIRGLFDGETTGTSAIDPGRGAGATGGIDSRPDRAPGRGPAVPGNDRGGLQGLDGRFSRAGEGAGGRAQRKPPFRFTGTLKKVTVEAK